MTDNIKERKKTAREQAHFHRDRMPVNETDYETIIDVFLNFFQPETDQIISAYWPVGREFDCRYLMDELAQRGFQIALPRLVKDSRNLEFIRWQPDDEMQKNAIGIPEPTSDNVAEPDIVLAPLLAFDQKGYRLGQGGGYYDSTIANLRLQKQVSFIGIGYAEQAVLFKLPTEEHDMKMDYMLTPTGVIDFGDKRV